MPLERMKRWLKIKWLKTTKPNLRVYANLHKSIASEGLTIEPQNIKLLRGLSARDIKTILARLNEKQSAMEGQNRQRLLQITLNGCLEYYRRKAGGKKFKPSEGMGRAWTDFYKRMCLESGASRFLE